MHRKLRELGAVRLDGARAENARLAARAAQPEPSKARAFAERVEAGLDGPVLRYTTRRNLIAEARRLGIGDFEANLLIAAVQHERRGTAVPSPVTREASPAQGLAYFGSVLVIVLVEAALAIGAWHVFGT
jgi:hypothetical protein